jgi:hypothetical protein
MTVAAFLERTFDEPLTPADVIDGGRESQWCFDLHRVQWNGSFLALDGRTMICSFAAPDMESARLAMRDHSRRPCGTRTSRRSAKPRPGASTLTE